MQNKTIACIIARTVSTRLPLKVLRTVCENFSMLDFIIERTKKIKNIDEIYLCTSNEPVDEILEDVANKNKIKTYRGSADMVIERLLSVAEIENANNVIRITGDNVFNAYEYIDDLIEIHLKNELDYSRITGLPFGSTPEILSVNGLKKCIEENDPNLSEYLTIFMFKPDEYKCGVIKYNDIDDFSRYTLTVDRPEDLLRTRKTLEAYKNQDKCSISTKEIIQIIKDNNIPNSIINPNAQVKLPNNIEISFNEFLLDLKNRASNSLCFEI